MSAVVYMCICKASTPWRGKNMQNPWLVFKAGCVNDESSGAAQICVHMHACVQKQITNFLLCGHCVCGG